MCPCTPCLPTFVSPLPELEAWKTDAHSFSWTGLWAYAYPPTPLIPQVLEKVRAEECEVILITLAWLTQAWFPALLRLLVDHPRHLPAHRSLLKQWLKTFHSNPQVLALHGWRLLSRPCESRASHPKWLGESLHLTGSLHQASMTAGGTSLVAGADIREGLICSLPLFQSYRTFFFTTSSQTKPLSAPSGVIVQGLSGIIMFFMITVFVQLLMEMSEIFR